jgi:hypothetical protein
MHDWTLDAREVSAGHYVASLRRSTGESIVRDGPEHVVSAALLDAFRLDRQRGVLAGETAFLLSRAAKRNWNWEYHEQVFGSWSGMSKDGVWRVDYDGKDGFLLVRTTALVNPKIPWQGKVERLEESGGKDYFDALLRAF